MHKSIVSSHLHVIRSVVSGPVDETSVEESDSAANGHGEPAEAQSQSLPGCAMPCHEVTEVKEVIDLEKEPAKRKSPVTS